jgi:hypothetical protein
MTEFACKTYDRRRVRLDAEGRELDADGNPVLELPDALYDRAIRRTMQINGCSRAEAHILERSNPATKWLREAMHHQMLSQRANTRR